MRTLIAIFAAMAVWVAGIGNAEAERIYSEYTKLNLEKDCVFFETDEVGGSAKCTGYKDVPIYFSEGDLRQQVRYGTIEGGYDRWESFSEFNHINDTVEWRIIHRKPFATILRWFIDNQDPHIGAITEESRGNVLVISKVGTANDPTSCIVGYIDARMNRNAYLKARDIADDLARSFVCGVDLPRFHGRKGEWSGTPTVYAE